VIDQEVGFWEGSAISGLNACCILEGGKNGGAVNLQRSVRAYAKSLRNCKVQVGNLDLVQQARSCACQPYQFNILV